MAKKKDSLVFYYEWGEVFSALSPEQCKELILSMISLDKDGTEYDGDDIQISMAMAFIGRTLDRNRTRYEERCERNRRNAERRWSANNANACDRMRTDANDADNDHERERDHERDRDRERERDHERDRDLRKKEERKSEGTISEAIKRCEQSFPELPKIRVAVTSACMFSGVDEVMTAIETAESGMGQDWLMDRLNQLGQLRGGK